MKNPYRFADRQIVKLKTYIGAEFHNAANEIAFDELNLIAVKEQTSTLFRRLKAHNSKVLLMVAEKAYDEALEEAESAGFSTNLVWEHDENIDMLKLLMTALLAKYHPVTEFVYRNEVVRKRDRMTESLMSVSTDQDRRDAYGRASRLWLGQSTQYIDLMVDEARVQAFKDAGVKRVMWQTLMDNRVCKVCQERHGNVYEINDIPPKPHRHCRCIVVPVR